jgi:DNA-binding transcriptional LysR family regulator
MKSNLNDIVIFNHVVESGSFTATANKLNMSKSVVSKYITRLENELGSRLFNRTTRRLNLTEAGELFYKRCELGLREIEQARTELMWLQGEPRGTLKVAAPMSFGVMHLPEAIANFSARYPAVDVKFEMNDKKIDLIKEGVDVAIRLASKLEDNTLIVKRIAPIKMVICASPTYLKKNGTPEHPSDLTTHSLLTYSYQHSNLDWEFSDPKGNTVTIKIRSKIEVNNSLVIRELLLADCGITRIPTFLVGKDIANGRLVQVLRDYTMFEASAYLAYPNREFLPPKVRAFIDFISERINHTPEWDKFTNDS